MSWQAYVDTNLVGTGKISKAAILGLEGGVWAHSADFTLSTDEQKAIVKGFTKPDDLQAGGIRLAGQKYVTISADAKIIQGKKGADGVVMVKTERSVLVAVYNAPIQAPEVTLVVGGLADHLIASSY